VEWRRTSERTRLKKKKNSTYTKNLSIHLSEMFDGRLPGASKRRVALGGRSAPVESREALLARTRAEREARQRSARENSAATTIQAAWRGRAGAAAAREAARGDWVGRYGGSGERIDR